LANTDKYNNNFCSLHSLQQ